MKAHQVYDSFTCRTDIAIELFFTSNKNWNELTIKTVAREKKKKTIVVVVVWKS